MWLDHKLLELQKMEREIAAIDAEIKLRSATTGLLKTPVWQEVKEQLGRVQRNKLAAMMQRDISDAERRDLANEARTIGEIASMPERGARELPALIARLRELRKEAGKLAKAVPERGGDHGQAVAGSGD